MPLIRPGATNKVTSSGVRSTSNLSNRYQPYPIYNYNSGLVLSRAPWLIPDRAFSELKNFFVSHGVLRKRKGYTHFGEVVQQVRDESVATGDGSTTSYNYTVTNTPMRSSKSSTHFQITDGTQVIIEDVYDIDTNTSTLTGDGSGTVDWGDNSVSFTFSAAPTDGDSITIDYEYKSQRPITGIYNYFDSGGTQKLIAFDTLRANIYSSADKRFHDTHEADIFTVSSSDTDWIVTDLYRGNMIITNGVDPIYVYDGSSFSELSTGSYNISTAYFVISYKERMIYLRPTEDGNLEPQRARWSGPGTIDDFDNGGYIDAPTVDWIISAGFIADRLVVFFERSVWALNYIADVDVPFVWEKLIDTEGGSAKMSTIEFSSELLTLGPVDFISCDTNTVENIGRTLPDFSLSFNQDLYADTYGAVLDEEDQVFWIFAYPEDDRIKNQIVFNYQNGTWNTFDMDVQILGYYTEQGDFSWENLEITWDDADFSWSDRKAQSGYPITLAGNYLGEIKQINSSYNDDGTTVSGVARTKALNPFIEQQYEARLGYVDIYYDVDEEVDVTLAFYEYDRETPYEEKTITLTTNSDISKDFKRLIINTTAKFHMVEIKHDQQIGPVNIQGMIF